MLLDDSNAHDFNVTKRGFSGFKVNQNILLKRGGIGNSKVLYIGGNLAS